MMPTLAEPAEPMTVSTRRDLFKDRAFLDRFTECGHIISEMSPDAPDALVSLAAEVLADPGMTAAGMLTIRDWINEAADEIECAEETIAPARDTRAVAEYVGAHAERQLAIHGR